MCAEKPAGHKYKDYKPGHSWFQKFQRRNKDLLSRHAPSKVSLGHAGVTKKMIEGWFLEVLRYIANIPGGMEALSDLRRVFNMDESGFAMDAGTGHIKMVMVPRGAWQVCKRARGTKEQVTVNAACNTAGDYMFWFLLFPGKIMM